MEIHLENWWDVKVKRVKDSLHRVRILDSSRGVYMDEEFDSYEDAYKYVKQMKMKGDKRRLTIVDVECF